MGQIWAIVDMDSRTRWTMTKLGENLFNVHVGDYVRRRLWKPAAVPPFRFQVRPSRREGSDMARRRFLLALPNELVDIIFTLLSKDWHDLVCLSVTCRAMWQLGLGHLHKSFVKGRQERTSSGHRVLCLGEYTNRGDLPPQLHLTADEEKELSPSADRTPWEVIDTFREDRDEYIESKLIFPRDGCGSLDWYRVEAPLLKSVLPKEERIPHDAKIVLRNLSKRAYVTGQAVVDFNARMRAKYVCDEHFMPCIGLIALVLICWSSNNSTNIAYRGPLHRGVWAGDRLDIIREDAFERLGTDIPLAREAWGRAGSECEGAVEIGASVQDWTDFSAEVLSAIEDIWVADGNFRPQGQREPTYDWENDSEWE